MAVFTAIATAIVGAISSIGGIALVTTAGALTTAGVIATSVIAGGLAFATAKVTGVFDAPKVDAANDPGVKVQLPPATDNRIPVMYGRNVTGSIVVDAEIKNRNNTMVYVCVISEKTDSGTYTVNKIYRGDNTLNFSGGYASATSANVISVTDPNATSTTNVANKLRVRVYAGNAQSSVNQIFPPGGTKVAAQTLCSTITADTSYEDLVYAVVEVDYDPENGLTDFSVMTFDITNSLSEPSNVLLDYLQNDRYGAGISSDYLDLGSFADVYFYSTAQVDYINTSNVTVQQDRWAVDGMLSTYVPVKTNVDQLCQTCATFFTYDPKGGKFKVVPNRAATTGEKANAFVFTDDNIISKITISTTELYSLYNSMEVEYPLGSKKDQTDVVIINTPSGDRNPNEPDNPLSTRYNLVNDNTRVHNLANIDLRQSRIANVIEFEADYSAIQVDVGDVVKVTNARYGYTDKLYRVMQVTEKESPEGALSVMVALLEYADSVYEHNVIQTKGEVAVSGIPNWWNNIGNTIPNIGNIAVMDNPNAGVANVFDPSTGNIAGNLNYANIVGPIFPPGGGRPGEPFISIPINFGNANVNVDEAVITVTPVVSSNTVTQPANTSPTVITIPAPAITNNEFDSEGIPAFPTNEDFYLGVNTLGFGDNRFTYPSFNGVNIDNIYFRNRITGATTQANTNLANNIPVNPNGYVSTQAQGDLAPGAQIEDRPPNNTSVANAAVVSADLGDANSLITSNFNYDIAGIQEGDFSIISSTMIGGSYEGPYNIAFAPIGNVSYLERWAANNVPTGTTVTTALNDGTSGYQATGVDGALSTVTATQKITISNAAGAAAAIAANGNVVGKVYTPLQANVQLAANSTIGDDPANGVPRAFFNNKFDILRLSKGDFFFDIP